MSTATQLPPTPPTRPADLGRLRRAVTWRSVILGLAGVLFICGLTPYNDFVVFNTYLVGNFLPVGLLTFFVLASLLVNAPLNRWAPRFAISTGEMTVAFAMALVSCALPSSGLMRFLPATLVGFHSQAGANADYADVLRTVGLPDWVFPKTAAGDVATKFADPVVANFIGRAPLPDGQSGFAARWWVVPWAAWIRPALVWSPLLVCVFGAVGCLALITRRQWVENERLPFPLAAVYLSLIEAPPPGRMLNPLFRSPAFWLAAGSVFAIHSMNALAKFYPRYVPEIPLIFDLNAVMSQPPLSNTEWYFKRAQLYFCVLGLSFFLQSSVAFSLWFSILVVQISTMILGPFGATVTDLARGDQTMGAFASYSIATIWVGRAHWTLVMRQMLRGHRGDEPRGRYLPYRAAGWLLLICCLGIGGWLVAVGASAFGAAFVVVMSLLVWSVGARVAAETGLPFIQVPIRIHRAYTYLAMDLPGAMRTTPRTYFLTNWYNALFTGDLRESSAVYTSHAIKLADDGAYADDSRSWRSRAPFLVCLVLAMTVGTAVAGTSMLYNEYSYAAPLFKNSAPPVNKYGVEDVPKGVLDATKDYLPSSSGVKEVHDRPTHFAIGAVLTAGLATMRLRFAGWPLHPVCMLLVYSWPLRCMWFSIFVGWVLKTLTVRFGGVTLYRAMRPVFLGMVIGEAMAVGFWLIVNLVLVNMGHEYFQTSILPV